MAMSKIYCEVRGKDIDGDEKCWYQRGTVEDPTKVCIHCYYFKALQAKGKLAQFGLQPKPITPKSIKIVSSIAKKKVHPKINKKAISHIKEPGLEEFTNRIIPFMLHLHVTYWENGSFLRWQLMRLNKEYRQDFDDVFDVYNEFDKVDEIPCINQLNEKYATSYPDEPFDMWVDGYEMEGKLLNSELIKIDDDLVHHLQVYKDARTMKRKPNNYIGFRDQKGKRTLFSPNAFLYMNPPPIFYGVHFPLPYFLEKLPSYEESSRGRKMDWGRNLATYELSHYYKLGEKDIACLLFGIEPSDKYIHKHKIFTQIKNIVDRIEKSVDKSYPLPPFNCPDQHLS